jgi:hypothetical protein
MKYIILYMKLNKDVNLYTEIIMFKKVTVIYIIFYCILLI